MTLGAAGCGGGSSAPIVTVQGASGASGAQGAQTLTKSQFTKQADSICHEANSALAALHSGTVSSNPKVLATQELQITRSELDSLQSLPSPGQSGSTLHSFLSALGDEVKALTQKQSAAEQGGDTSSAEAAASNALSSAQTAAGAFGLKECAKGGLGPTGAGGASATTTTSVAPATPTTTTPLPATPTPPSPTPAPAPSGGTAGGGTGGGTAGGTGGGGSGGTGGSGGGVSP
jgi:hypothetical protein